MGLTLTGTFHADACPQDVDEPWPLEIIDHEGVTHQVLRLRAASCAELCRLTRAPSCREFERSRHLELCAERFFAPHLRLWNAGCLTEFPVRHDTSAAQCLQAELVPGEMLLYEGATCAHGRPTPLNGNWMANIFVHMRPAGLPSDTYVV